MKRKKAVMAAVAAALAFSCAAQVPIGVQAKAAELPAEERPAGGLTAEERVAEELAAAIARQGGAAPYAAEGIPGMLRERASAEDDGIGAIAGLRSEESEGSLRASKSNIAGKKKLKKYILKHGKKMADGNKGITMKISDENEVRKGIIEYTSSEKTFRFQAKNNTVTKSGKISCTVEMKIPLDSAPKSIRARHDGKISTGAGVLKYSAIGTIKVASYSNGMATHFKITKAKNSNGIAKPSDISGALSEGLASFADAEFRMGMAIWERMLVDDANTSMKEIGFRSFSQ